MNNKNNYITQPDGTILVDLPKLNQMIIDSIDIDILNYKWNITNGKEPHAVASNNGIKMIAARLIGSRIDNIDSKIIVHNNGNTLDNRRCNLKITTQSERQKSRSIQSNNTSGITGISYDNTNHRWIAYIHRNSIHKQEYFTSPETAIAWRKAMENKY